jgi:sugar lactone lactonase YvrE
MVGWLFGISLVCTRRTSPHGGLNLCAFVLLLMPGGSRSNSGPALDFDQCVYGGVGRRFKRSSESYPPRHPTSAADWLRSMPIRIQAAAERPAPWQPPSMQHETPIPLPLSVVDLPSAGAEDILIDRLGSVVTGLSNGDVLRVSAEGVTVLGNTRGRPLGIEEYPDGNLLVCDHDKGLLRLDVTTGDIEVVVDEVDGKHLHFCSNAGICADGTIYFSSSSETATWKNFREDVIKHATSGRLIRVSPTGEVSVLCRGLAFANGVAIAPDESFLLVAETIGYRILKFWLRGPRAGEWVDFITGTPGFPDNISLSDSGLVWVSLPAPRVPMLDFLLPRHPILRDFALRIPERLQPQPKNTVWVQAYDLDGKLVHNIKTTHPRLSFVTAAAESNGTVWLASAHHDVLGRIDLTRSAPWM